MKPLVCWLLFFIASLVYASEELLWTPVTLPEPVAVGYAATRRGVWFKGEFGWLNGGGHLWLIEDTGRNWKISLTAPERGTFYDAYFVDALKGWAVTGLPYILFQTSDGGATWQPVEFELIRTSTEPRFEGAGGLLVSVYFKDLLHGLGLFVMQSALFTEGSIIARTDDGGQHWREIWAKTLIGFGHLIGIGEQVWIEFYLSGNVLYTPDFGGSFQMLPQVPTSRDFLELLSLDFLPSKYGWALVRSLLREGFRRWEVITTSDGGFTWSPPILSLQGPPPGPNMPAPYMSACLLAEGKGAVLWCSPQSEASAVLYFTSDVGASWLRYTVPIVSGYRLVCNRERQELWLIPSLEGGGGNILFVASIPHLTAVKPSSKLPTLWGIIKNRKEY